MIKRGRLEVKQGGRGKGDGENPTIVLENGILAFSEQKFDGEDAVTIGDILGIFGNSVKEMAEYCWTRYQRFEIPSPEGAPSFWSDFWTKYSGKLVKPAVLDKDSTVKITAEDATKNARAAFARAVGTLAPTTGQTVEALAELMIQSAQ